MKEVSPVEKLEIKEKEPKISYEFFYSAHRTAKDFEKLEDVFNKSDVYVPEAFRWTPEALRDVNNLSQGRITIKDVAFWCGFSNNSSRFKEFELIEGSKKPILFVDLPEGHRLMEADKNVMELRATGLSLFKRGEFAASIQIMREGTKFSAEYFLKREEVIKKNIKKKVRELIANSPKLKAKKEVSVLIKLGGVHTGVYHRFKKELLTSSWHFSSSPTVYSNLEEAYRRIMLSRNKESSDELLARALVERSMTGYIYKLTNDTEKAYCVLRKIASKLDLKNIEEISEELGKGQKILVDCLEERGIKVPKTEKEMDEMLGMNS